LLHVPPKPFQAPSDGAQPEHLSEPEELLGVLLLVLLLLLLLSSGDPELPRPCCWRS
jgi:hypothetical protein